MLLKETTLFRALRMNNRAEDRNIFLRFGLTIFNLFKSTIKSCIPIIRWNINTFLPFDQNQQRLDCQMSLEDYPNCLPYAESPPDLWGKPSGLTNINLQSKIHHCLPNSSELGTLRLWREMDQQPIRYHPKAWAVSVSGGATGCVECLYMCHKSSTATKITRSKVCKHSVATR